MLSFLKTRNASGYSQKDYKIANQYAVLYREGDGIGAAAVLSKYGWDHDKVNDVLNDFDPDGAAAAQPEEDDTDPEPFYGTETPEPTSSAVEKRIVNVPATYGDSLVGRANLIAALWGKFGEGWQVESFDASNPAARTVTVVRGELPSMRPGREVFGAPNATAGNGEAIAASHAAYGRTMLGYDPYRRLAETAVLPPATIELRNRLLRKNPRQKSWELELLPIFGVRNGEGYLARVIITRADQHSPDRDKEVGYWIGLAKNTIGHQGWYAKVDDQLGTVEMIAGVKHHIPDMVGYDYAAVDAGSWGDVPIGTDGYGDPVQLDLASNPHTMVVGKTNSGKSVGLRAIIFAALVHGWDLVVIDPTKRGLDFTWARGYVRDGGWGCLNFPEAQATIEAVYAEGKRRLEILVEQDVEKWTELPEDFRRANGFKPIMVVIDEFTSLSKMRAVPKLLEDHDQRKIDALEANLAKEILLLTTDNILRELRFVGVHVSIGTQVWNVTDIGTGAGGMRTNMGNRLQFGRASNGQLGMAFSDASEAGEAYELAHNIKAELTDAAASGKKGRPGRGIAELDGVGYVPFQGAFATKQELANELEKRGIYPRDAIVTIGGTALTDADVTDLGTLDFGDLDLDDLEEDAPDAEVPVLAAAAETVPEETNDAQEAEWAATQVPATEPAAAPFDDEDDPFAEEATPVRTPRIIAPVEEDPFASPPKKEKAAAPVADSWWD
ncbi:FtsK/SpoIIIE domain-containing protein [Arthrobacter sp. 2MCAF14]|uniref:FtsK/SpoIIIE domain-containing protein n=1 Tax=Arthrobacter sp. 2MCAF14 TaxID=3232982 RepID=UPI003F8E765A